MTTITADRGFAMDASRGQILTGRVLAGLVAVFLAVDGAARVAGFAPYVEGTVRYGFEAELAPWLGGLLLAWTGLVLKDGSVRALVFAALRDPEGGRRSGR